MLELTTIKAKMKKKLKERRKAGERRKFKILFTYFLTMLKNSYMMMITLIMRSRDVNNNDTTLCTLKRLFVYLKHAQNNKILGKSYITVFVISICVDVYEMVNYRTY